jgi:hypothetical protein
MSTRLTFIFSYININNKILHKYEIFKGKKQYYSNGETDVAFDLTRSETSKLPLIQPNSIKECLNNIQPIITQVLKIVEVVQGEICNFITYFKRKYINLQDFKAKINAFVTNTQTKKYLQSTLF